MTRFLAVAVATLAALGSLHAQRIVPDEQRPVFRAGAHFVRVDAYPARDGRIVEDLSADDFEVLEDGKPQGIQTFQFIKLEPFTSDEQRRDPNSQRDAFALAEDPSYRVFVLYLDAYHVDVSGSWYTRPALTAMLRRMLGPRDLFGMLTPRQMPRDLILGRQTQMIEEQLGAGANWAWGVQGRSEYSPEELQLQACFGETTALVSLRRTDKVFSDLEELVGLLGGLRQERKNIVLFTRGWTMPVPAPIPDSRYRGPRVGITEAGKLTLGKSHPNEVHSRWCQDEALRLSGIDFRKRHRDLVVEARRQNVTFYPVNPSGLEAPGKIPTTNAEMTAEERRRRADPTYNPVAEQTNDIRDRTDRLIELATNTDGKAIVNTNDLSAGLRAIADDLQAYYVLGYYTTNAKWDGGIRKITVRLRKTRETVRARREYRAPTEAEMATLRTATARGDAKASGSGNAAPSSGPTPATALAELARLAPNAALLAHGVAYPQELAIVAELTAAQIEARRWQAGGEVQVLVNGAGGADAAPARGRIEPGARGTLVRVPVSDPGPWTATVRLRAPGESDQFAQLTIPALSGLVGEPLAYRAAPAPASPRRPVAAFQFRRTERIQVEWAVLQPLDRRDARVLGRDGHPLALQVDVFERESAGRPVVGIDLNLAPLTAGDYVIELTAGAGDQTQRRLLAIRVVR